MKPNSDDSSATALQDMLRYLAGAMNATEVVDLDRRLKQSPELRRAFALLLLQDVQLNEIGQEERFFVRAAQEEQGSLASFRSRIAGFASVLFSFTRKPRWALGLASALIIGVGLAFAFPSNEPRILEVKGRIHLQSKTGRCLVQKPMRLALDQEIALEPQASVTIGYGRESTRLRLTDSGQMRVMSSNHGKLIFLDKGCLTSIAASQGKSTPLRVRTKQAEATILGTQFMLSTSKEATRLEVWNGDVQLTRSDDGASVHVVGGQFALAGSGLPLRAENIQGGVLREVWSDLKGNRVGDLTSNPAYPDQPTFRDQVSRVEFASVVGDFYGLRLRGWLHAPNTGQYHFFISADDEAELWLSRDETADEKVRICFTPEFTGPREWKKHPEQASPPIHLDAGRRYYIEVLMKQSGGGECLGVAWQGPGQPIELVQSAFLSPLKIGPIP